MICNMNSWTNPRLYSVTVNANISIHPFSYKKAADVVVRKNTVDYIMIRLRRIFRHEPDNEPRLFSLTSQYSVYHLTMPAESSGGKPGFKSLFTNALRPKKSRQVLRKGNASAPDLPAATRVASEDVPEMPPLAPLQAHREKYRAANAKIDTQIGEDVDYTTMLHSIGLQTMDDPDDPTEIDKRPPGEEQIASLSSDLWLEIADYLNPTDAASLAFSSITLYRRLGARPWKILKRPENRESKAEFLAHLSRQFPHHLLCFPCGIYHRRIQEGRERLQPSDVINPIYECPNMYNSLLPPPRHRIAHARSLPFSFVQLALRAHRFSPAHGIPAESLARRWRRDGWSHNTRYHIHKGHLLMRVVSSIFAEPDLAPTAQRMVLYSQEDYWPYFSACPHWRDGELMNVCKCALTHIPKPRNNHGLQGMEHRMKDTFAGRIHDPNAIASLCGKCRPMRRCPQCPTEYLIEIKLTEDRSSPRAMHFRHAIVVTRWSDLGDGSTPTRSAEWAACNGLRDDYDSFTEIGHRGISSIFEASITADTLPGQRIISMNPKNKRLGEEGTNWY